MGIIKEAIDTVEAKNRVLQLKMCKADLNDDGAMIGVYNKAVDRIVTDVQAFLGKGNSTKIVSRLSTYMEPREGSDGNLNAAKEYIQYEINSYDYIFLDGGGGGSW